MPLAAAEHRVNDRALPGELDRLKAFLLPVGRRDAVALFRIVVVHHHRVHADHNQIGSCDVETPHEQFFEDPPEDLPCRPGEQSEEPLDGVG